MKRIISILLVLILCVSFAACGKKGDDSEEAETQPTDNAAVEDLTDEATESTAEESKANMIDFTTEKGAIKYLGFENANEGLIYENQSNMPEKAIVLKFTFTNLQDTPQQATSAFRIQEFQNSVEITDSPTYSSGGGDQYKLVSNRSADVLKNGTVTFGEIVAIEDDSPLTIIVKDNGGSESQQMEIDVTKPGDYQPPENTPTTTPSEPATEASAANMIDFTTEKGTIKYLGFEKANSGLIIPYENQSDPTDKAIVLRFEFTNLLDTPNRATSAFRIQAFQNGLELEDSPAYSSKGGNQYNLVKGRTSDVLKGGKVTFGMIVLLTDDSPLTIIVTDNGGSENQTMEIDVTKPGDYQPTKDAASASSSKTDNAAPADTSLETTKPQETVKKIKDGDIVKTNDFEFTLKKVELTYEVKPKNTSGYYHSYESEKGKIYIHVDGSYYNKSQRDVCIRDLFVPAADFNNGYQYEGFVIVDDGDKNFDWVSSYVVCTPLETCHYHGLIECPEVVKTQKDAPLFVTFKIDGTTYRYDIR